MIWKIFTLAKFAEAEPVVFQIEKYVSGDYELYTAI